MSVAEKEKELVCTTPGCGKSPSTLSCPTCVELSLPPSHFCSQECFRGYWKDHNAIHKMERERRAYQPYDFNYTGALRPHWVSPMRAVPAHIPRPEYADSGTPVTEMKLRGNTTIYVNTKKEIEGIRAACKVARQVLDYARTLVRPGITTEEIDLAVHNKTIELNAYPSPLNYHFFPKSCCTSINEVICHGIPDARKLEEGDIINVDVTCYYKGFHGDINETYPVGRIDDKAKLLIKTTYESLDMAIKAVRPGTMTREFGNIISKHVHKAGFSVVRTYCFPGDHQILTKEGWEFVTAREILENTKVATFNPNTKEIEYHPIDEYIVIDKECGPFDMVNVCDQSYGKSWCQEPLYCAEETIHTKPIFVSTTADHEWYIKWTSGEKSSEVPGSDVFSSEWQRVPASELSKKSNRSIKLLCNAEGGLSISSTDVLRYYSGDDFPFGSVFGLKSTEAMAHFMEILGFWISNGDLRSDSKCVRILPKTRNHEEYIESALQNVGLTSNIDYFPDLLNNQFSFYITRNEWWSFFSFSFSAQKQRVLPWMLRLEKGLAQALLKGVSMDTNESGRDNCVWTSSPTFRDHLCRISLHAGYSSEFQKLHNSYRVSWHSHPESCEPSLQCSTDVVLRDQKYSGSVYCVRVPPHHLILCRRALSDSAGVVTKASQPVIIGNCGHGVGALFHHPSPNIPHYSNNKAVGVLKPSMVFTIEPMINEGVWKDVTWPDNWTSTTTDGKRSAQFEHTILVTEGGCEVLTARTKDSPPFFWETEANLEAKSENASDEKDRSGTSDTGTLSEGTSDDKEKKRKKKKKKNKGAAAGGPDGAANGNGVNEEGGDDNGED